MGSHIDDRGEDRNRKGAIGLWKTRCSATNVRKRLAARGARFRAYAARSQSSFFKKYENFAGNYGNAWWRQKDEFESFNGPILMTTNCIVPPKDSCKDRLFTTGAAGYPGCKHIDAPYGEVKDFSQIKLVASRMWMTT